MAGANKPTGHIKWLLGARALDRPTAEGGRGRPAWKAVRAASAWAAAALTCEGGEGGGDGMLDECMQGVMAHLSSCNKEVPTHLVRVLRSWLAPAGL